MHGNCFRFIKGVKQIFKWYISVHSKVVWIKKENQLIIYEMADKAGTEALIISVRIGVLLKLSGLQTRWDEISTKNSRIHGTRASYANWNL